MTAESSSKLHHRIIGFVVSHKPQKTAVVKVVNQIVHPKYKKRYTTYSKHSAHDPNNICKEGDKVEIIPSKPFSKTKRFSVVRVIE